MITVSEYKNQKVGVFGLGKAGNAAIESLLAGGAEVFAWDDSLVSSPQSSVASEKSTGARRLETSDYTSWPWPELKALILSPGVPLTHPKPHAVVELAHEHGVPVIGEMELLYRACPDARYIGITGTNGKSTTTTLIGHILKEAGLTVEVGGNLGTPALALAPLGQNSSPCRGEVRRGAKPAHRLPLKNIMTNARDLRKNLTDAEQYLWSILRREQLGVKFRKQHPVGHYVADFACLNPKLIVELDGGQHNDENAISYDERRTAFLNQQGFEVLRFCNNDVLDNVEGVVETIYQSLYQASPPPNLPPTGGGTVGTYVIEMSSYQLDLVKSTRFNIAAFLNITPDHLDRHGDMEGYVKAKMHIFDHQQKGDVAVIAVDDEWTKAVASGQRSAVSKLVQVSVQRELQDGIYVKDGVLIDPLAAGRWPLAAISTLTGRHNWQNAAVAWAVARACDIAPEVIYKAMQSFTGLRHRLQLVATIKGVRFINDSKATNADATSNALAPYQNIYWIAGGKQKEGGIESLQPYFHHISHAFLIGQAVNEFAKTLEGKVNYTRCGTLDVAVKKAAEMAFQDSGVVLLSPACASFDQFKSFEHRGDEFCALVENLSSLNPESRILTPGGKDAS